jgi:hypothetical protein
MIPPKSHPKWKMLVTDQITYDFKLVSGSMLLGTLVRKVKKDNSPEMIDACIDDAREFFQNFEEIFRDDLKVIFG